MHNLERVAENSASEGGGAFTLCSMFIAASVSVIEEASLKVIAGVTIATGLGMLWARGYSPLNIAESIGKSAIRMYNSVKKQLYKKEYSHPL